MRAASTANVTATYAATGGTSARGQITAAPNTLDGLTLVVGDRLLKNQSVAAQNGIWVVTAVGTGATGVWDRAADWDADGEVLANTWTRVTAGTQNQDSLWRVTDTGTIVVGGTGGTSIVFASTGFSPWSALLEISLTVGARPPPVRITEINYRPVQGGQAAEFVEIQNIGSAAVDVSNWYFDGIQFVFPHGMALQPGARAVVASNRKSRHFCHAVSGVVVTGYFGGSLDDGGERIDLFDRDGALVTSVEYDNNQPWPPAAAAGGYSLEVIDPAGDPQDPANWRASTVLKGTPGTANGTPALPAVRISEFFLKNSSVAILSAYPQFIELENFGPTPVDISAWQLAAEQWTGVCFPGSDGARRQSESGGLQLGPSTAGLLAAGTAIFRDRGRSLSSDKCGRVGGWSALRQSGGWGVLFTVWIRLGAGSPVCWRRAGPSNAGTNRKPEAERVACGSGHGQRGVRGVVQSTLLGDDGRDRSAD